MQKRDLDGKVSQEASASADLIASDLAVARAHVDSIAASLAREEKQAAGDDLARVKLNALEANLASTRTMYESFVTRLRATQDQDDIQNPESRIISRAPIPDRALFAASSAVLCSRRCRQVCCWAFWRRFWPNGFRRRCRAAICVHCPNRRRPRWQECRRRHCPGGVAVRRRTCARRISSPTILPPRTARP